MVPSSDGLIVVEAAPREVVLLALGLLRTGRALGAFFWCHVKRREREKGEKGRGRGEERFVGGASHNR